MDRAKTLISILLLATIVTLLGAVIHNNTGLSLTGKLTFQKKAFVSVDSTKKAEISRFEFDQFITIGNSTLVDIELKNIGSTSAKASYQLEVYNINNSLLFTYPGPKVTLQPGDIETRTIRHTPHETGTYILRLKARIGTQLHQTAKFLIVQEEPEPPEPDFDPITIIRKRVKFTQPPPLPESEPLEKSWRIDAPATLNISQGRTRLVPIKLTNTGEAVIETIRPTISSSGNISLDYNPKIMFAIGPNETKSFALDVTAPRTVLQNQEISYKIVSRELSNRGRIAVNIEPSVTIEELQKEINSLHNLILEAKAEISASQNLGVQINRSRDSIAQAENALEEARNSLENRELENTEKALADTRKHVNTAFQNLFESRSRNIVVQAPLVRPVYLLILASIIITGLMVGAYYYFREQEQKRPKLLREAE